MQFVFPEAWYFLPLIFIPILINLYRYFNKHVSTIPTLFFVEKLLKSKRFHRSQNRWLEMILEILILLVLIFLLSQPIFSQPKVSQNKLMILLDDSPSMKYFFIDKQNPFVLQIKKWLEEKRYHQIDIQLLSQLEKRDAYVIKEVSELETFFEQWKFFIGKDWNIDQLRFFLEGLKNNPNGYDYILYSDLKENHFNKKGSSPPIQFPNYISVVKLPKIISINKLRLEKKNFFEKENLEIVITLNDIYEEDIFLEVKLEEEVVFLKKIIPPNTLKKKVAQQSYQIKFPITLESGIKSKALKRKKLNPVSPSPVREIEVSLKKNKIVFQNLKEVIFVYPQQTISFLPKNSKKINFFKTLFSYDLDRGNIQITHQGKTTLVLSPNLFKTFGNQDNLFLFFLDPKSTVNQFNYLFKKWGLHGLRVEKKKVITSFDKIETPYIENIYKNSSILARDINFKDYFLFSFNGSILPFPIITIQKQPVIFTYKQVAFFNGWGLDDISKNINPNTLVWIYEILYSLWGKLKVQKVSPLDLEEQPHPLTQQPNDLIYRLVSPSLIEYQANQLEDVSVFFNKNLSFDINQFDHQSNENNVLEKISWLDIILLIEIILILLLIYVISRKIIPYNQLKNKV